MHTPTSPRIVIVADWLIDFGGAELVISHLLELFPEADIATSVCFMDHPMLQGRNIQTTWIQKIPFLNKKHKLCGILRPFAFRALDLSAYDIIISSSSAEAKNAGFIHKKPEATHICYCHTPIRYYWSHFEEYKNMMEFGWLNPIARGVLTLLVSWLRKLDFAAAQKVDIFLANSKTTAARIEKYYQRKAQVVYPGIDGSTCLLADKKDFYLGVSRCIPYKKMDLLVDAFNENGKKLVLITNTDTALYHALQKKSNSNITWIFAPNQTQKMQLFAEAKAFLFPPEEDFGLVPVEAMLCGTPVIAYGVGGATESVVDGETGLFFTPQTPQALNEAIERSEKHIWDAQKIRHRGLLFEKQEFQKHIRAIVQKAL